MLANGGFQSGFHHKINSHAQNLTQVILKLNVLKKNLELSKLNQNIKVTLRSLFSPNIRAENPKIANFVFFWKSLADADVK